MSEFHLYRCYSNSSAGKLRSGKGDGNCQRLSSNALLTELALHIDKDNRVPTALISMTSNLVRAIQLAFLKSQDGEADNQITIAFIKSSPDLFHHAEVLVWKARGCRMRRFEREEPILFRSEYLAEWEISPQMVTHTITLETLLRRYPALEPRFPVTNTEGLRKRIADKLFSGVKSLWDLGLRLGYFARCFGARAPLHDISSDIFTNLMKPHIDNNTHMISYSVVFNGTEHLPSDIEDFLLVQDGIDTVLLDWWLLDDEFLSQVEHYKSWVADARSEIQDEEAIEHFEYRIESEAIALGL